MVRCIKGAFTQLMAQQGPAFTQIEDARRHLAGLRSCTGTVGVIGYCMGGAFALAGTAKGAAPGDLPTAGPADPHLPEPVTTGTTA